MTDITVEAVPIILDNSDINATTINLADSFGVNTKSEVTINAVDAGLSDVQAETTFDMMTD